MYPSFPSMFLFLLTFSVVFIANGINANTDSNAAETAEHEQRLAADIAALKEKLMDDSGVDSIYPCNLAPTPMDEKICLQLLQWKKNVAKLFKTNGFRHNFPPVSPEFVLNVEEQTPSDAEDHYHCMDLLCLCPLLKGKIEEAVGDTNHKCVLNGSTLQQAVRKEYRMLTKEERQALHQAFRNIKLGKIKEFDRFAMMHKEERGPSAHGGPGFLPWHREYLKRMEIALRRVNASVALPYWDVTLDAPLDNPRDSILWSSLFLGDIEGNAIKDGAFLGWTDFDNRPLARDLSGHLLLTRKRYEELLEASDLTMFNMESCKSECVNKDGSPDGSHFVALEKVHGQAHMFVGGTMSNLDTAANDPAFYFYHTFIDFIWEKWRQKRQTKEEQESVYPEEYIECCKHKDEDIIAHYKDFHMMPFNETGPLKNIDGLSIKYTHPETGLFRYADRPTCSAEGDCNSDYLFCHRDAGTSNCVSKIKPGGKCEKFQDNVENPCYNGTCIDGKCRGFINIDDHIPMVQHYEDLPIGNPARGLGMRATCTNNHECCWFWYEDGLCREKPRDMNLWCPGYCRHNQCVPDGFRVGIEELEERDNWSCLDYHQNCKNWIKMKPEECVRNPFWTTQNCRESCGKCHINRRDACRGKQPDEI